MQSDATLSTLQYRFFTAVTDPDPCMGQFDDVPKPILNAPFTVSGTQMQVFEFDGSTATSGATPVYYLCESTDNGANFYGTPVRTRFNGPCILSVNQGTDAPAVPGDIQVPLFLCSLCLAFSLFFSLTLSLSLSLSCSPFALTVSVFLSLPHSLSLSLCVSVSVAVPTTHTHAHQHVRAAAPWFTDV